MNPLVLVYFGTHVVFAMFLGPLFAFAPDEGGYLHTFSNLYNPNRDGNPQLSSGWITAPKVFLWVSYLPAKLLTLVGVPEYFAIRLLSIALGTLNFYLLKEILETSSKHKQLSQRVMYTFFFIPSIFFWTSLGLRESFILAQVALILCGISFLVQTRDKKGALFLILGSYGLISTKNYLWLCLIIAMIFSCIIFGARGGSRPIILKLLIAGFVLPLVMFFSTTSIYALNFIFKTSITATGERTSISTSTFLKDSVKSVNGENPQIPGNLEGDSTKQKVSKTFILKGNSILNGLSWYLIENPNSAFTRGLRIFGLEEKIKANWTEQISIARSQDGDSDGRDGSLGDGQTLTPARITEPLSFIPASAAFLLGPIPFSEGQSLVLKLASLESPIWWTLYLLVLIQFLRFRKEKILDDLPILLSSIFLIGMILMSALVEVNIGTSFRHRLILFTPLIFIYGRLPQLALLNRDKQSRDKDF